MAHVKTAVDTQAANIAKATWAVFLFPSNYASYHAEAGGSFPWVPSGQRSCACCFTQVTRQEDSLGRSGDTAHVGLLHDAHSLYE